jgi:hypothetical protein
MGRLAAALGTLLALAVGTTVSAAPCAAPCPKGFSGADCTNVLGVGPLPWNVTGLCDGLVFPGAA